MCYSDDPATSRGAGHAHDWRVAVEHALHAAGLRTSSARAAVLDWITVAERPFTAEMIVQQLVNGWGTGSRPTVYRTVDWLRGGGWLARLHREGNDRAYVRSLPGGYQLICTDCGESQIITDLALALLVAPRLQDLGFELQHEHLELYGRCRQCRRAEATIRKEAASAVAPDSLSATQGV
ncbi:MAG: transcriptional repressor [Chloroflexi bacterium]|nr:transcriptional repressor [Chloroflexota bacterium]